MKIYIEKEQELQIDKNTRLILLNANEFVTKIKEASQFVPARHISVTLKYKLIYNDCEYNGESIFNSYKEIRNYMDGNCPYIVNILNWNLSNTEEKYLEFTIVKV